MTANKAQEAERPSMEKKLVCGPRLQIYGVVIIKRLHAVIQTNSMSIGLPHFDFQTKTLELTGNESTSLDE